jgi:hypothetical protein
MRNLKKRLAILVALIMIVPYIITGLPNATITSLADAGGSVNGMWWISCMTSQTTGNGKLVMQVGQSVEIGGFMEVEHSLYGDTTGLSLAGTFSSTNTKVATVNKKGVLVARKTGRTTVTCNYGGQKLRCSVTVLKKGSIKETNNSYVRKFTKNVNSLNKIVKQGINWKNCYTIYNKLVELTNQWDDVDSSFEKEDMNIGNGIMMYNSQEGHIKLTYKLVVPAYNTYKHIQEQLYVFLNDAPTPVTNMGLQYKAKTITTKRKGYNINITVKTTEKVTKKEFFKAWVWGNSDFREKYKTSKSVNVPISLYNKTSQGYVLHDTAPATITFNSNKIVVHGSWVEMSSGTYRFNNGDDKLITGTFKIK